MVWLRVVAPHFVCGVAFTQKRVVDAAPICRYMLGWTKDRFIEYTKGKGWKWEILQDFREKMSG